MITLIKFPASFSTGEGERRTEMSEFKLGKGPCGKDVRSLDYTLDDMRDLLITQECQDGSRQTFHYRHYDIVGRIEVHWDQRRPGTPRDFDVTRYPPR